MGNCTVAIKRRTGISTTGQTVIADVTMSASYATGGDTLLISDLGMKSVSAVILSGASPTSGVALSVVHGAAETTNPKIKAYQDVTPAATAPFAEVAAATNLSTHVVRAVVFGDLSNV